LSKPEYVKIYDTYGYDDVERHGVENLLKMEQKEAKKREKQKQAAEEEEDEQVVVPGVKNIKQMKARHQLFEHPKDSNKWYEKAEVEKLFYNDNKKRVPGNRLRNYLNYGEADPSGKKDGLENDLYVDQKNTWHNNNPIPTKLDEIWSHKIQQIKNRTNAKGPFHDAGQQMPKEYTFD